VKSQKEKLAETQFDSLDAMIVAYAAEAVRVAADGHRVKLDYSLASVATLEAILAGQSAVDLEYQTRTWGGYFGEVLRRRWGGEWSLTQYPNAVAAVPTLDIAAIDHGGRRKPDHVPRTGPGASRRGRDCQLDFGRAFQACNAIQLATVSVHPVDRPLCDNGDHG
jgi:hypothetical protein